MNRTLDLFAGAGGMSLGFERAGFRAAAAIENDPAAAETWSANLTGEMIRADIAAIRKWPDADLVIGGPPCPAFSSIGRVGSGTPDPASRMLWQHFARAVDAIRPRAFVLENVPPLFASPEYAQLRAWARSRQYAIAAGVLNAADFGAPQIRKRAIIIGDRTNRQVRLPEPTHGPPSLFDPNRPAWRTLRDAFVGIDPFPPKLSPLPARQTKTGIPGPFDIRELHAEPNTSDSKREMCSHVPPGGDRWDIPMRLWPARWTKQAMRTEGKGLYGRLRWDKPSSVITTRFNNPSGVRCLHPEWQPDGASADRPITPWEAARIQGFPDRWRWHGNREAIHRQIGNAIPPALAEAVARTLI